VAYDTALEVSDVSDWVTFDSATRKFTFNNVQEYSEDSFRIRVTGTLNGLSVYTEFIVYVTQCPAGTTQSLTSFTRLCITDAAGSQEPVATVDTDTVVYNNTVTTNTTVNGTEEVGYRELTREYLNYQLEK